MNERKAKRAASGKKEKELCSCGDIERRERTVSCKTDRKLAKTITTLREVLMINVIVVFPLSIS